MPDWLRNVFFALNPWRSPEVAASGILLRPRIVVVLILLAILFIGAGLAALRTASQARQAIALQNDEHYPAVAALEKIKHSASRLTGAVVMQMAGREAEGYAIFHQNAEILTENVNLIASLPPSPGRDPHVKRLREQVNVLLSESERIISRSEDSSAAVGFSQLLSPRVLEISETADNLLNSQRSVALARQETLLRQGRRAASFWWAATALGVGLVFFGHRYLQSRIFEPVATVRQAIDGIGEGELDQTVSVSSGDEVGRLCLAFNHMTSQLRATRKGTTEQMVRLHRIMETTLASFPNAFFVLGKDRNIELRNPAADKLAVKLFLEGQAKLPNIIYEHIDQVLETGQNYLPANLKDALKLHIDNEEKFFLPRVLLLQDERGETFGVAVVLEDVTHQRLLDDVKTNLLSTVSHELKTPLTSVRMGLHLLLEKEVGPLNDRQLDLVTTAKEDSERLLRTLNNLLDLTKLEETAPQLVMERCAVRDLVEAMAGRIDEGLERESLRLTLDIEEGLPGIWVDREKLDHVFSNFATNALKHSPPGGEIIFRARSVLDDQVRISVIDHGPGISKEHQARIFDKFYRVPGQASTGAGLGLSIAREIALLHRGSVGVISEAGQGSEFYLDLPVARHESTISS